MICNCTLYIVAMVRVDRASGPRWVRVDVVYATPVGEVFDLAVLKIREHLGNLTAVNVAASIHKGRNLHLQILQLWNAIMVCFKV